jgi:hypothetical protein
MTVGEDAGVVAADFLAAGEGDKSGIGVVTVGDGTPPAVDAAATTAGEEDAPGDTAVPGRAVAQGFCSHATIIEPRLSVSSVLRILYHQSRIWSRSAQNGVWGG